jgi:hypothetical protein
MFQTLEPFISRFSRVTRLREQAAGKYWKKL